MLLRYDSVLPLTPFKMPPCRAIPTAPVRLPPAFYGRNFDTSGLALASQLSATVAAGSAVIAYWK